MKDSARFWLVAAVLSVTALTLSCATENEHRQPMTMLEDLERSAGPEGRVMAERLQPLPMPVEPPPSAGLEDPRLSAMLQDLEPLPRQVRASGMAVAEEPQPSPMPEEPKPSRVPKD